MSEVTKIQPKPSLLVIGPTPPPHHGVSVSIAALLTSSISEKFDVYHVDLADRRGIEHVDKPDLHDVILFLRQWVEICRTLLFRKPRMVYLPISQNTVGFLRDSFIILTALLSGARVVVHLHGANLRVWYLAQPFFFKSYAHTLLKRTACGIVLGKSLRHIFDPFLPPHKVFVVPNGIQRPETTTAEGNRDVDAGKYTYRVVHMSTLMRQKGALVFIEAIPRVIALRRDVEFILVGPWANDADKKWAEDFIKETGIGDHVRFTGPLTGKAKFDLLRSCDLFVFPGIQQEGQPLVVLEAMAVGLPVLFSARGCLRETVIEGLTGKEIKVNDPSDLAIKILWLLDHPDEMKRMGLNSKTRHENMYSIGHHIEALTQTLTTALSL